ncbi:hypothetical protein BY996DRAFT_7060072 [Phakopsora pachyrhizi]|uniref:Large ribosomal subunit protein uL23m n=1 Tax=Phakopsora pachyrhizi TaxID=170000 RepID=A0AAV0B777_PHAPC|nr:hypothetical protein BY996DRAFT_7060072 [Phakopsora pachyrhizi]CAH7681301.1 hypothetical protein PPACK8108_LOCUS13893 [Phakopsora pachyrhizi]CAH7681453.1 hypothetical protein PPACK8108_LOCUS14045 [Phakopsora pachyrhizi]
MSIIRPRVTNSIVRSFDQIIKSDPNTQNLLRFKSNIVSDSEADDSSSSSNFTTQDSLNLQIREAVRALPPRPTRLDQPSIRDATGDDADPSSRITWSINNESMSVNRLESTRVGSNYCKARSPVYFPNVSIRLVRPSMMDKWNPFLAIFRCDLRLTKPDIFNYLRQIYGLGITSIRTAIYRGRHRRQLKSRIRGGITIARDKSRTFKKVWIGLDRPFFYPDRPSRRFLDENFMYSDVFNTFRRAQLKNSGGEEAEGLDRRSVLPSGLKGKGERRNVLRELLDSKMRSEEKVKSLVEESLNSTSKKVD